MDIDVRTIDALDLDAATIYERLRSFTPGRASYLLESHEHDTPEGRYSVVGYRVRQRALLPPGLDAVKSHAADLEPQPRPESFAAALALGTVGYVSSACANVHHRLAVHEDEGPSGQFIAGATVLVIDHRERTMTIAGPKQSDAVERCLWEAGKARPPLAPLPAAQGEPDDVQPQLSAEALVGRASRAKPYFGEELSSLVLGQTFFVPLGEVDAFDVYRALCETRAAHSYYIDFGAVPGAPDTRVAGIGRHVVHLCRRDGDATSFTDAYGVNLPHRTLVGEPAVTASRVLRKLEDGSRHIWGGAVGYLCPGGEAAFVLADDVVTAEHGQLALSGGALLNADSDPASLAAAARHAAAVGLAAIHRAQRATSIRA